MQLELLALGSANPFGYGWHGVFLCSACTIAMAFSVLLMSCSTGLYGRAHRTVSCKILSVRNTERNLDGTKPLVRQQRQEPELALALLREAQHHPEQQGGRVERGRFRPRCH